MEATGDLACPTAPKIVGGGTPLAGCYSDNPWAIGLGGTDVFGASNTHAANVTQAWAAGMSGGRVGVLNKWETTGYWPVRGDGRPTD